MAKKQTGLDMGFGTSAIGSNPFVDSASPVEARRFRNAMNSKAATTGIESSTLNIPIDNNDLDFGIKGLGEYGGTGKANSIVQYGKIYGDLEGANLVPHGSLGLTTPYNTPTNPNALYNDGSAQLQTGGVLGFGQDSSRLNALSDPKFTTYLGDQGVDINSLTPQELDGTISSFNNMPGSSPDEGFLSKVYGGKGEFAGISNAGWQNLLGAGNLAIAGLGYLDQRAYNKEAIAGMKLNRKNAQTEAAQTAAYRASYDVGKAHIIPSKAKKDQVG